MRPESRFCSVSIEGKSIMDQKPSFHRRLRKWIYQALIGDQALMGGSGSGSGGEEEGDEEDGEGRGRERVRRKRERGEREA